MESESEANSSLVSSVLIIQNLLERNPNIIYTVIIGPSSGSSDSTIQWVKYEDQWEKTTKLIQTMPVLKKYF